jgi:hypothetical protein
MLKTIAFTTLAAMTVAAFAQSGQGSMNTMNSGSYQGTWRDNPDFTYDTYNMNSVDINSLSPWRIGQLVKHSLKGANAADAYTINNFIELLPPDQGNALLKALAINYKQASIVRDEVAMARYGTDQTYAWLNYPALTWTDTPGQNSWSSINFDSTPYATTPMNTSDAMIALTDDQSRPMRMVMRVRGERDIDYDRAVGILCSGLSEIEKAAIREVFHPAQFDPATYTNAEALDSIIRVVESNAKMADNLGRYAWYNHFDKDYYSHHMGW